MFDTRAGAGQRGGDARLVCPSIDHTAEDRAQFNVMGGFEQTDQARAIQPWMMADQPSQDLDVVDKTDIALVQRAETGQARAAVEWHDRN